VGQFARGVLVLGEILEERTTTVVAIARSRPELLVLFFDEETDL
jgi:hypothetical protein